MKYEKNTIIIFERLNISNTKFVTNCYWFYFMGLSINGVTHNVPQKKILNAHQNCDVIYEQTFWLSVNQLVEFVKVSWFIIILLIFLSWWLFVCLWIVHVRRHKTIDIISDRPPPQLIHFLVIFFSNVLTNTLTSSSPKAVTSFMDDPLCWSFWKVTLTFFILQFHW